jgi:hypothetical protein
MSGRTLAESFRGGPADEKSKIFDTWYPGLEEGVSRYYLLTTHVACQLNGLLFEGVPPLVLTINPKHPFAGILKDESGKLQLLSPDFILQNGAEST